MLHLKWKNQDSMKQIQCTHTDAKKYMVHNMLTVGHKYEVKNETEEYYFIVDNAGKVSGFYKEYFAEVV
ncbi:DUF6501 family protein [Bacillus sp. 2205SS5-2]|uniref:DUF6501 family protein n=1 Tax=Bacillus sp. 2205SS5-2 TaxID=3109031 RepID=UPI003005F339